VEPGSGIPLHLFAFPNPRHDRFSDALGKLTEEETWNLDAMSDALDRRNKESAVH